MAEVLQSYAVQVPGENRSLAFLRMALTTMADEAGLGQDSIDQVEIAVDEACTNVVEHAYRQFKPHPPIYIEVQVRDGEFVIDIFDEGPYFDFDHFESPRFPDHWWGGHCRGAGIYLIRSCVDQVQYDRLSDERNRLRLIKRF